MKQQRSTQPRQKKLAVVILVLFLGVTALVCWRVGLPMVRLASDPEAFRQWLTERQLGGALIYGAMVFFQVLFAVIPGEPLEIAGGYAFGALWGTIYCLLAATLGSLLVFVLVRRFGTRLVEVFFSLEKLQKVRFLQSASRRNVLFLVVFMIPGTPKDLLCYFAGLTDIKLPVFLLLAAAFFGDQAPTVMMLVMLSGWVFALLVARLLRSTIIKGEATPFVMELPPYRLPTLFSVLMHCWERTWMYVKKAGTVILAISIIIWAGLTYPKLDEAESATSNKLRVELDRAAHVPDGSPACRRRRPRCPGRADHQAGRREGCRRTGLQLCRPPG